jgi:hypothetical protein
VCRAVDDETGAVRHGGKCEHGTASCEDNTSLAGDAQDIFGDLGRRGEEDGQLGLLEVGESSRERFGSQGLAWDALSMLTLLGVLLLRSDCIDVDDGPGGRS